MPTYAIGDVQGCFAELQDLLKLIHFDPDQDTLWFAGDLVNRGPDSLAVLRFVMQLKHAVVVLGNHDLHLLALYYGHLHKDHTLGDVLAAPDLEQIVHWLRQQPLMHYDKSLNTALVHAGILPSWSIAEALKYAAEIATVLRSNACADYVANMYGNQPDRWEPNLQGHDRLRFITNAFTRMRFCDPAGHLDMQHTGPPASQPDNLVAWYKIKGRKAADTRVIFGHWAAANGRTGEANAIAIDTGCVWGNKLTAYRVEDGQLFSVPARDSTTKL